MNKSLICLFGLVLLVVSVTAVPEPVCRRARRCSAANTPICGSDGKIYQNACLLNAERDCASKPFLRRVAASNCLRKIGKRAVTGGGGKPCNLPIPLIYSPVCGSDGVVYANMYQVRARNQCHGTDVEIVDDSNCPDIRRRQGKRSADDCFAAVPAIWAPVCGSDGKIWDNPYLMEARNRCDGTSITVVDSSLCPELAGLPVAGSHR